MSEREDASLVLSMGGGGSVCFSLASAVCTASLMRAVH